MIMPPANTPRQRGFGGMLLIATFGLAVLVFGGILTNSRSVLELRGNVDSLQVALERHAQLKPMDRQIQAAQESIQADLPPQRETRLMQPTEIQGFRDQLVALSTSRDLTVVSISHSLESTDTGGFLIRFDYRMRGDSTRLPEILDALHEIGHPVRLRAFSIRSVSGIQELQIIFTVGMQ